MSRQSSVPSTAQVQGAQFVNDFINHPDFRLVASFSLGWVFFSSLRHILISAFVRELVTICKTTISRLRGKAKTATPTDLLEERTGACRPASVRTAHFYRRQQRDTLMLLLCMAFLLASLSSFLSLLIFNPNGSGAACTFVVAVSAIASQATRVFGLLILGLDLRDRMSGSWELWTFWSCLALATIPNGITVGLGSGQLVTTPLMLPTASLCFRKRFLPTSLTGSILNIALELYILIRILSLMKPPRLQYAIVQDTLIVRTGSLLLFDLLVVVPEAIPTSVLTEFILFSVGALAVLLAFYSSLGQSTLHRTPLNVFHSVPRPPSRAMMPSEPPILQDDTPNNLVPIENNPHSAIALTGHDIEAAAATSLSPQVAPRDELLSETNPVAPLQPAEISFQTMITYDVSPLTQDAGDFPRRQRILSYSNPIWATLGARQQNIMGAPTCPHILIEFTGSPPPSNSSHDQDGRADPSRSSTILGSDIIRDTSPIHYPLPEPVTRQSWVSVLSVYPPNKNTLLSGPSLLEETTQQLDSTLSRSSKLKSRKGSKSSRGSRSSKNSIGSARKIAFISTGAENLLWPRAAVVSSRLSRGFLVKNRRARPVGVVRGPRPSPSASRILRTHHG